MITLRHTVSVILGVGALAAAVLVAAPAASADVVSSRWRPATTASPRSIRTSTTAPSQPAARVLGSAPDQTAILNCSVGGAAWRAVLSQFVNGGPYPGIAVGIG